MTYNEFIARFPEYKNAPQPMVVAHIEDATKRVDPRIFRAKTEMAIGFLAAATLARSPFARTMRPAENKEPDYWDEFIKIRNEVTPRSFVV
jgi:hypothetical protein